MGQLTIQPSFAAGELAPSLWARVDLAKYHVGAKTLRNFFVLASGGAANRPGTAYVGRCKDSTHRVRLIPFQFSTLQTYVLEFGQQYMRVIMDGGYVLEPGIAVYGATQSPGCVVSALNHGFNNGDWVYISGVTGMTPINSSAAQVYLVSNATANNFVITDLDGNPVNSTQCPPYAGGGTVARIYTMATPYLGSDLALLKFTQSDDVMTLCHPSYPPQDLTRTQHWAWSLAQISFQPHIQPPVLTTVTGNNGTGPWYYSYVVTAVTNNPAEESLASNIVTVSTTQLNQNTGVQNTLTWSALPNASYYRVYKANPCYNQAPANGSSYGYIGTTCATSFADTNIGPDFTDTPPRGVNPFLGAPISSVSMTATGSGYPSNARLTVIDQNGTGALLTPTVTGGKITGVTVVNGGELYTSPTIAVTGGTGALLSLMFQDDGSGYGTFMLAGVQIINGGSGYIAPTITAPGGAVMTPHATNGVITSVTINNQGGGMVGTERALVVDHVPGSGAIFSITLAQTFNNPGCVTYFQQRKIFGGGNTNPDTLWMTQPGAFTNMDTSNPSQATDAITISIANRQVNAVTQLVSVNALLALTASGAFKISGGAQGAPITPSQIVAAPQAYNGCSDVPPIVINNDILYVSAKGARVRDLAYNFYADIYTGSDMTVLSPHLFFGHQILEWAYVEEPFNLVWAVREDGILLGFTYLKEQDIYAWTRHDTQGAFLSVASIAEGPEDAAYVIVSRTIPGVNGGNPVQYVERFHSRNFLTNGIADITQAWFVDCGLQYSGPPTSTVSGLNHLNGLTVVALADGNVVSGLTVSGGQIALPHPASTITVGLPYSADLQTLDLEISAPTIQGRRKKITAVTVRLENSRGLKIGYNSTNLAEIKERTNQNYGQPIPLTTGDEHIVIPQDWNAQGDLWVRQDNPLPATVLAIIPESNLGNS